MGTLIHGRANKMGVRMLTALLRKIEPIDGLVTGLFLYSKGERIDYITAGCVVDVEILTGSNKTLFYSWNWEEYKWEPSIK